MSFTVADIAKHLGGEITGDGSVALTGFAPAETAKPGDLTFAEDEKYLARAEQSAASAIIVSGNVTSSSKILIRVPNARVAFAKALPLFFPEPRFAPGIHPTAVIAQTAVVDKLAHVGPHCVISERAHIGARAILQAGDFVGDDCVIGEDTHLFPNVTVYPRTKIGQRVRIHSGTVVGSDGFGYVQDAGAHFKVQQIGNVIIEDDVEIGACVTIDRGALGATHIGKGTKIDNLVQIAHNVVIGEHCIVVGQAGIAGSTKLGNYVVLAGQSGVAGHLTIGDKVIVGGRSAVMNDINDGGLWMGAPAIPHKQAKRQLLAYYQLPEALKRLREVEKKLGIDPKAKEKE